MLHRACQRTQERLMLKKGERHHALFHFAVTRDPPRAQGTLETLHAKLVVLLTLPDRMCRLTLCTRAS